eukprot:scaffold7450_cov267-Pinguiococcus_pyrenoidosus.AAC.2
MKWGRRIFCRKCTRWERRKEKAGCQVDEWRLQKKGKASQARHQTKGTTKTPGKKEGNLSLPPSPTRQRDTEKERERERERDKEKHSPRSMPRRL